MNRVVKTAAFMISGLILLLFGAPVIFAQDGGAIDSGASAEFIPETAGDFDQSSIANAGDVNGDGYDDILIGAGTRNNNTGVAYLILGRPDNWSLGKFLVHQSIIKYSGEAANHWAGSSVAGAGDVNGDGFDDMLVGAYGNNTAYLILGSPNPASANLSTAIKYSGEQAGHQAGSSVAGTGDVNGDGYDDMLVGARGSGNSGSGGVYLVLGSPAPTSANLSTAVRYNGEGIGDEAGSSVAGAGDVNGDGYDDMLVGVSKNSALTGADVAVTRHIVHPCYNNFHLEMPIWDVESAKLGSGTTLNMVFEYTDAQMGDMVESNFKLYWRPIGKHCSNWTEVANSSVNTAVNQVTATGQTTLGQYTIADALPPPTSVEVSVFNNTSGPGTLNPTMMSLIVMLGAGGSMALWRYRQERTF